MARGICGLPHIERLCVPVSGERVQNFHQSLKGVLDPRGLNSIGLGRVDPSGQNWALPKVLSVPSDLYCTPSLPYTLQSTTERLTSPAPPRDCPTHSLEGYFQVCGTSV